jgi:hypothetical protein
VKRAAVLFGLSFLACGESGALEEKSPEEQAAIVLEARVRYPVVMSIHQGIIARSCASTEGVCHNAREYPDLHTPGNLVAIFGAPCNADKLPAEMFAGCEPVADILSLDDGSWASPIAWMGVEEWNEARRRLYRRVILAEAPPAAADGAPARILRAGKTIALLPHNLSLTAENEVGEIHDLFELDYEALNDVRGGDPNHDGALGAADPWSLVSPQRLDRSYLWGRLTGEVPGTQMPPAATALTDAELLAIRCWIETAGENPAPQDPIHYDRCGAAQALNMLSPAAP